MREECNYCVNKRQCDECDKWWRDKFIPSGEVEKYFSYNYVGVRGINGYVFNFNTTNKDLKPTHHILIDGVYYCPYCGELMYPIQDENTLAITGHCCICQGARDEIEYEEKKRKLDKKYEEELSLLKQEYRRKLSFCTEKLFEIKQKQEKEHFNFARHDYDHFSIVDDSICNKIDQII